MVNITKHNMLQSLLDTQILFVMRAYNRPLEKKKKNN